MATRQTPLAFAKGWKSITALLAELLHVLNRLPNISAPTHYMIEVREKRMGHHEGGRSRSRRDILPERDQERHPNRTTLPTTGPSQPSCVLRSWQSEGRRVKFLFQSCKAQVREIKADITQRFEGGFLGSFFS